MQYSDIKDCRDKELEKYCKQLEGLVGKMMGKPLSDFDIPRCLKVLNQAADFIGCVKSLSGKYRLVVPSIAGEGAVDNILREDEYEKGEFTYINVETGKKVGVADIVSIGPDGSIGWKVAVARPGLTRVGAEGSRDLVLSKAEILVGFDKPIEPAVKPTTSWTARLLGFGEG
jgi:hypothetical protein